MQADVSLCRLSILFCWVFNESGLVNFIFTLIISESELCVTKHLNIQHSDLSEKQLKTDFFLVLRYYGTVVRLRRGIFLLGL